jgi:alkylation response protein AidB-like acyl-CoA dehydrogenase
VTIALTEEQLALQEAIRAAAASGLDWNGLEKLGLFEITRDGGTLADVAAALEQVADALVPGPILPTLIGRLVADGDTFGIGFEPDGRLVLGAGEATHLLLTDGRRWHVADAAEAEIEPLEPLDMSRAVGAVRLSNVDTAPIEADVENLAATLFAAEAAGVAGWCERTATAYAKVREQFGRPIGSFQAIKHMCAAMRCRYDRAAAVAWDAARAYDEAPAEHPLAAAVAAAIALDAAVENAKDCIQVLGGIGFTWEHPAHRYLRRALSLRQLLGGSAKWRVRAASLAMNGARRDLGVEVEADPATRAAVTRIAALPVAAQRVALADAGFLGWDKGVREQLAIDEELARAGVEKPNLVIGGWAAPTIERFGTAAQRERFVAPTLRGEITWCQLFSEPGAGSDLAALRTRASRMDGGWRLTGQKVWTSLARQADWAICLARTDFDAPKHQGITYFLVRMDSPGIDIRPLRELTGESVFNEVFLDEVFVPDDCVVGEPGEGWKLARGTLANERVAMGRGSSLGDDVERLVASATEPTELLGALVAEGLAVSLLDLRATLRQLAGGEPGAESAVRKLVGVQHRQAVAEAALLLCGSRGAVVAEDTREAIHQFLLSRCLSIAGGTTQILLSLVGERVLGLPREP